MRMTWNFEIVFEYLDIMFSIAVEYVLCMDLDLTHCENRNDKLSGFCFAEANKRNKEFVSWTIKLSAITLLIIYDFLLQMHYSRCVKVNHFPTTQCAPGAIVYRWYCGILGWLAMLPIGNDRMAGVWLKGRMLLVASGNKVMSRFLVGVEKEWKRIAWNLI